MASFEFNHSQSGAGRSAVSAGYESQGQVRSEAERIAPGHQAHTENQGLKGRNTEAITPFQGWTRFDCFYQGRRASRLPLAFIFRAFGASILILAVY